MSARLMTGSVRWTKALLPAVAALALGGCFGGGGDDVVDAPPADPLAAVPDAAVQTAAGTVDYQRTLAANASETREGIDLSTLVLPSSETDEPVAVD